MSQNTVFDNLIYSQTPMLCVTPGTSKASSSFQSTVQFYIHPVNYCKNSQAWERSREAKLPWRTGAGAVTAVTSA